MKLYRSLVPALALVAGLTFTAPAQAQPRVQGWGSWSYGGGYDRAAFDKGYRDGIDKGRDDGHDRDRYDPRHHKWYREGDRGYNRHYGSRYQYEAAYRQGFLRGYDDGYRQNSYHRGGRW
jgi:hypothetical protein